VNDGFEGKTALVTGAARGLGLAIARELDTRGATVVLADIDEGAVREATEGLRSGEAVGCDVRDEGKVTQVIENAAERHGGLDVVVANAGIAGVRPLVEMSLAEWRKMLSINLDGVFLTATAAARVMAPRGSGSIVTMGSVTAMAGAVGIGHYAAAKAGVVNLTKTLATELRPTGVRVNSVCPGFIETAMVTEAKDDFEALLPEGMSFDEVILAKQGRYGTPEDVASAVCFLAGDRTPWITGAALVIDGGMRGSLL